MGSGHIHLWFPRKKSVRESCFTVAEVFSIGSNQGQAYFLMYFLPVNLPPTFDQAHPVQMGQTNLFKGVKTGGLLSPINNIMGDNNVELFQHY